MLQRPPSALYGSGGGANSLSAKLQGLEAQLTTKKADLKAAVKAREYGTASDMKKEIKRLEALVPIEREAVRILVPMADATTPEEQERWCTTMVDDLPADRNLSKIMGRLLEEGVCQGVVAVMLKHPEAAGVQLQACRAINWITFRSGAEDTRASLHALGASQAVVLAMTRWGEDAVLLSAAAAALANLAYGSETRRRALCQLGAPEQIMRGMHAMASDVAFMTASLRAIRNLSYGSENVKTTLDELGVSEQVVSAIQLHPANADLVTAALWAMCNLTYGSEVRTSTLKQLGAMSAAKKVMRNHKSNSQLRSVGAYITKTGVQTKREVMVLSEAL